MEFIVSGKIMLGKENRTFSKKVTAESENDARHKAYALFGSANGVKRNKMRIEKIEKSK
jgi:ribosomal protein L20A (L18A)